jgi:prepilin-type N-terminal cleavage/methylation domain-containing protein
MISNKTIEQFKQLDVQTIEGIADEKLRQRALALKKKQGGFTLLELLVVVAILAVLGGLAIGSYGDKTTQAARGGATNTIAAVDAMVRSYQATAKVLPNDLDTLVCANPTDTDMTLANTSDYGGVSDLPNVGGGIGAKLKSKISRVVLPDDSFVALSNAGITRLRYGLAASCADSGNTGGAQAARADADFGAGLNAASPVNYPTGNLSAVDIPNRGFDFPQSATGNRGRGFVVSHTNNANAVTGNDVVVQAWKPGALGVDNRKVGAQPTDVLAVFGLGNNASMFTDASGNRVGASAPFYGDVGKDKYGRYTLLVKIGTDADFDLTNGFTALSNTSKASFITVLDARGDFLDEEYAEANGQKL